MTSQSGFPRFDPVVVETRQRHLRDWLGVLWERRLWALGAFALTLGAVGVFTAVQRPVYRASAKLAINPPQSRLLGLAESTEANTTQYGGILAQERFLNTQYEIIRSPIVLERVVARPDVKERPPFRDSAAPARSLMGMLRVDTLQNTNVAVLEVRASTADDAALLANAVADTYTDWNISSKLEDFQRVRDTLARELNKGIEELGQVTKASLQYQERSGDLLEMADALTTSKIQEYETSLIRVRQDLALAEGALRQARAGDFASISSMDPGIASLVSRVRELEIEKTALETRYLPKHELVQKKSQEVEAARGKLLAACEAAAISLRNEHARVQGMLGATRSSAIRERVDRSQLAPITSEASTGRLFLEKMMARLNEVDILPAIAQNNVQIIERAVAPRFPSSPKRLLNILLGLVLGTTFGVGLAFFVDYLDVKVKTADDVERFLGLPLLAVVPRIGKKTERHAKEAIQSLRTGILFASRSRTHKAVLVTSTTPQEGKSFTSVNLARAFAMAGERTVLLECDFRVPAVSKLLGVPRSPGLSNYLGGPEGRSWRDILRSTDVPGLFVLPTGDIPPNPPDLLSSARMKKLMDELRAEFDWVLVDSPPVATMSDAQILASLSDLIVFVVRHGGVEKPLALRAVQALRGANPGIAGAVLNAVDPSRASFPEYYYGRDYYLKSGTPSSGGPELLLQTREERRQGTRAR